MELNSKTVLRIAEGVCETIFLGYCKYFDHKRHNVFDFEKRLPERRCPKKEITASGLLAAAEDLEKCL